MTFWIDAQLSPALAGWLSHQFAVEAIHIRDLKLVEATNHAIFEAARQASAVVLTKDRDFVDLIRWRGAPPQIVWITCGNTSNREMMRILSVTFAKARELIAAGEPVVEIKG